MYLFKENIYLVNNLNYSMNIYEKYDSINKFFVKKSTMFLKQKSCIFKYFILKIQNEINFFNG